MSPQKVRRARIVLLKLTHWPFVLAIFGYEAVRRLWVDHRKSGSSGVSRGLSQSPTSLRRRKALSSTRPPLLDPQSLDEQPRPAGRLSADDLTAVPETIEGLSSAVADLKAQVETLTEMLMKERQAEGAA